MLSKALSTFGRRLAHQKCIFKGPMLRAPREPECNSTKAPQLDEITPTTQLPDYTDPEQQQDGKQKSYDHKYNSYSLYDLHDVTTRLAEEQSKNNAKH